MRRVFEIVIERILMASGAITSLVIVLMVLFLFSQGSGLFKKPVVEEGYTLVVNSQNAVSYISPTDIKDIYDGIIVNWDEVGGVDKDILLFRLEDITNYVSKEDLGEDYENLPTCLTYIIENNAGIIAFIPQGYVNNCNSIKHVEYGDISFSDFITGTEWFPTAQPAPIFGVLPLLLGTLQVAFAAIALALPFGLAVAIYMAELASSKSRRLLKPIIELLAGIPSVVYGFFGLVVIVPFVQQFFNLPVGETGLTGAIILAIMALPTIITVAEDAIRSVPRDTKEASFALGASQLQTITRVTLPYAISGITAAVILGIGRAIGETMAVLMVTGNAAVMPTSLLEPVRTIPATIAAELGEAPAGGAHYEALFLLGAILFVITLIISISVEIISSKRTKQQG